MEIRKRCEDAYENNGLDGGERSMVGQGPHHSTHFRLSVWGQLFGVSLVIGVTTWWRLGGTRVDKARRISRAIRRGKPGSLLGKAGYLYRQKFSVHVAELECHAHRRGYERLTLKNERAESSPRRWYKTAPLRRNRELVSIIIRVVREGEKGRRRPGGPGRRIGKGGTTFLVGTLNSPP